MQMKKHESRLNYFALVASTVFLIGLTIFSLVWYQKQNVAADWITHTFQVKYNIEKTYGLLIEIESNQRGYLLVRDIKSYKIFEDSKKQIDTNLSALKTLVADNPKQGENLAILKNLIKIRLARLQYLVDSTIKSGNQPSPIYILPGKIIMDSIRSQIYNMENMENSLLTQRILSKKKLNTNVLLFIILFSIISLTVLIGSFFKIKNENLLRTKAELDSYQLEATVIERTNEIQSINRQLKDKNILLERKNTELTSFTYIASHDLKEPLRKIEMFTQRIIQLNPSLLQEKSMEYFTKIIEQGRHMQKLIDSVLQFAQMDAENIKFKEVDLDMTAKATMENLNEMILEKKAIFIVENLPVIQGNPEQLEQLFTNLISNALKYSKPGVPPHIQINAVQMEVENRVNMGLSPAWKIDFTDNGIGFDEKYKGKIFEVFQRLHSKEEYSGTGIGLAICRKIVENHHGFILVKSIPGEGSVFSVILP
jgi:signal transduction histidine kinase